MSEYAITRHHVDIGGRNVHYRRCGQGPPVVLLHASPRSGVALEPLMLKAPSNLTLFAFDTPGCGDSQPLALHQPDAGAYGDALNDTLAALRIERAAVYGTHTGAAIAMALAERHPERVAALVLDGLSVFTPAEQLLIDDYMPPFVPRIDGSHLAWLWSRVRDGYLFFPWNQRSTGTRLWRPIPAPQKLHAGALDLLRAGDGYRAPYAAAFRYQPPQWMSRLRMPVFIGAREDDVLLTHLARLPSATERPANVRVETLPANGPAWSAKIWAELLLGTAGLPNAPAAVEASLPQHRIGSTIVGASGARIHLRGALAGTGRPRVLLHDSPGGARGLETDAVRVLQAAGPARPVIVPDWPAHGDSDDWQGPLTARALAGALSDALRAIGIEDADVEGAGAGGCIAAAWAADRPTRICAAPHLPPSAAASTAPPFTPRDDGGHLHAAWQHARDEAILGPLWARRAEARHSFGDGLELLTIHRRCIEALKETPNAHAIRSALWCGA